MRWALIGAITLAAGMPGASPAAGAELASRAEDPYRIAVAVRFSDDPTFTRLFVDSVCRQVRDQLVGYFGVLAEVRVLEESWLPEWPEALTGLPRAPAGSGPLDKLFLMAVDGDGGAYRVRWRQADYEIEHLGPVHARTTPDRHWLAKAICLAVKEDFSPVALVEPVEGGRRARLSFHGSKRGTKLSGWLEGGCVLQPFWVIRGKTGELSRTPVPHTVLTLGKGEDTSMAEVVSGRADPLRRTARVAGFQAIKLTTQTGRLRLRLVNSQTGGPVLACTVSANSSGFDGLGDRDRLPDPDPEGWVVGPRPLAHLAYVGIAQGRIAAFRLPVPITSDWVELEYAIPVEPLADEKNDWHRQIRYRVQDVQVLQGMLDASIREINTLNQEKKYEEALKRVEGAVGAIGPLVRTAREGVQHLDAEGLRLKLPSNALMAWTLEQLQEVEKRETELARLAEDFQAAIRQVDAHNRAKVLLRLAGQAETAGDFDEAIAKYAAALSEWPDQPQVRQHLDELRQAWTIKSPEHEQARQFVLDRFARAKVDQLAALLPEARPALAALRKVDDFLTARQLLKSAGDLYRDLADVLEMLAGRSGEADRQEAQRFAKLAEDLDQFRTEIKQYLESRGGQPPQEKPAPKDKTPPSTPPKEKPAESKPEPSKTPKPPDSKESPKPPTSKKPTEPPPIGIPEEEEKPLPK